MQITQRLTNDKMRFYSFFSTQAHATTIFVLIGGGFKNNLTGRSQYSAQIIAIHTLHASKQQLSDISPEDE
jgi:hypothetical protein